MQEDESLCLFLTQYFSYTKKRTWDLNYSKHVYKFQVSNFLARVHSSLIQGLYVRSIWYMRSIEITHLPPIQYALFVDHQVCPDWPCWKRSILYRLLLCEQLTASHDSGICHPKAQHVSTEVDRFENLCGYCCIVSSPENKSNIIDASVTIWHVGHVYQCQNLPMASQLLAHYLSISYLNAVSALTLILSITIREHHQNFLGLKGDHPKTQPSPSGHLSK